MSSLIQTLLQPEDFILSGVSLESCIYQHYPAIRMTMPREAIQDPEKERLTDRDFMAWLPLDFCNGEIELWVASELVPEAPAYARGFIGVSFRINEQGQFESIYLRPTNSQADDQVRRNHSVQYVAFPDYRFDRLRRESPEQYETYAELELARWTHMRINVKGQRAVLYLNNQDKPAFIVNDLKLGSNQRGGVGVWLESGTVAYFRELKIRKEPQVDG
ncbi:DUF1080 domain-containing protein [Yersinia intermedia]|uniref:DUF1080 domain-containing protein n=1 Tax=Yersinia intermedia TaxID=631 RepID=UPI001CFC8AE3|nr:DUF1080 domain-containing protein [Yersinia intermedia]MCB5312399.1 DUF1080 domain-containing protein [Yersinia intermedia]MCB5326289.1 DUF1080 domain-containing protein [Yersinia intermedia]UZM69987.1 DUF1080 domain-containing protein [Yersinia intermedia]